MSADTLLGTLRAEGYTVAAAGDVLHIGPAARLTDELRAAIRTHKPALLALLAGVDEFACLRAQLAAATLAGYRVLRFTPQQVANGSAGRQIRGALAVSEAGGR
jgi:hypothetical protein